MNLLPLGCQICLSIGLLLLVKCYRCCCNNDNFFTRYREKIDQLEKYDFQERLSKLECVF